MKYNGRPYFPTGDLHCINLIIYSKLKRVVIRLNIKRGSHMFSFYKRELDKEELRKAAGESLEDFEEKIQWLQEKWCKKQYDSNELRLMSSIIIRPTNAINFSIISDNIEYFKDNYLDEYGSDNQLKKALKLACLCGSKQIADFLLNKLEARYSTEGYDFVLGYACTSNNLAWVEAIAKAMKEDGVKMPDCVYGYADYNLIDVIEKIFNFGEANVTPIRFF